MLQPGYIRLKLLLLEYLLLKYLLLKYGISMSHLLITRRLDPLQRVRDAEFLILIYTQCMIRQDIYALDVGGCDGE